MRVLLQQSLSVIMSPPFVDDFLFSEIEFVDF